MSLPVERSDYFWADLEKQIDRYRERAGSEVALFAFISGYLRPFSAASISAHDGARLIFRIAQRLRLGPALDPIKLLDRCQ